MGKTAQHGLLHPRWYNDDRRANASMAVGLVAIPLSLAWVVLTDGAFGSSFWFGTMCGLLIIFMGIYTMWTYVLFSRTPIRVAVTFAKREASRRKPALLRWFGFGRADDWATASATVALLAALGATVASRQDNNLWMVPLVVLTTAGAWASILMSYATRYFRLVATGETIVFDIDDEPDFDDYVAFATAISAAGSQSVGTARSRLAMKTVRRHTIVSFVFNTLVIAVVLSLMTSLVTIL